jgi:hypothetical protein
MTTGQILLLLHQRRIDIVWAEYIGLRGGQGAIMRIEPRGACVDGVKERKREE